MKMIGICNADMIRRLALNQQDVLADAAGGPAAARHERGLTVGEILARRLIEQALRIG